MVTQEYLKEQLRYEPDTGLFYWSVKRKGRKLDKPVGSRTGIFGTYRIYIDGTNYSASKLAWFYVTGNWIKYIGYKDFNPINLKWNNLEELNEIEHLNRIKATSRNGNNIRPIVKNYSTNQWFLQNWDKGRVVKGPYFDTPLEAFREWTIQNSVSKYK